MYWSRRNVLDSGHVEDCGCDGAGEVGDKGCKDCWIYDGLRIHIVVAVFFVVTTPGSAPSHTVGFVSW